MNNWRNIAFSGPELTRYSRHLSMPDFGMEGQKKLKAASVLAVGAGGLGAPMLQYLAAAGVGTIGLIDFDTIETSNLHRQVLFGASDVGRSKIEVAKERLQEINPHITVNIHETRLTSDNALDIIQNYDIVADGTDNFSTRYLINDACVILNKTNVYGSIFQFEGQVSVFNCMEDDGSRGPNYRDLFPEPPPPGQVPSCAEAGVLGVLPGIIGSIQGLEIIKAITGIGALLSGRLFLFDALKFNTKTVAITKNKNNPLTGEDPKITELIDYEQFCGTDRANDDSEVPSITVQELNRWRQKNRSFQLIDTRKPYEVEIAEIGGELIPLETITEHADRIARDRDVVIYCRIGQRSSKAVKRLQGKYNFDNLYNLEGGILAWAKEIDESIPQY